MERTKWTERKFAFDFPEGWLANILERLRGTGIRMEEMTVGISNSQMEMRPGDKWSIKEHIGHLADLEELHIGRLDDFENGKEMLRPADMSNAKTNAANHNQKSREALLEDFRLKRAVLVLRFEKLDDKIQLMKSMHPRLQTFMRPVDVAFFAAEHDDHHLASMRKLLK